MKKIILLLLFICMLIASPVCVFAEEVVHFEENHTDIPFEKYGITIDLPGSWGFQAYEDEDTYTMFPTKGPDVIMMLQFVENDDTALTEDLKDATLVLGAESITKGLSGKEQINTPEVSEFTKGKKIATTVEEDDDHIYIGTSTHCGNYLILLGMKMETDKYVKEYSADIMAILDSVEEL